MTLRSKVLARPSSSLEKRCFGALWPKRQLLVTKFGRRCQKAYLRAKNFHWSLSQSLWPSVQKSTRLDESITNQTIYYWLYIYYKRSAYNTFCRWSMVLKYHLIRFEKCFIKEWKSLKPNPMWVLILLNLCMLYFVCSQRPIWALKSP